MTLEKMEIMRQRIKEEAKDLSLEQNSRAFEVFMDAYTEHKAEHGSYKHLEGVEYCEKMQQRYSYMFNKSLEYIQSIKQPN